MNRESWQQVNFDSVYRDAERVVREGTHPSYSRAEYQDAMLKHAYLQGSTFVKMLDERDSRMELLYSAAERADYHAATRTAQSVRKAQLVSKRDKALKLLTEAALLYKRAGETQEQAMARLLTEDSAFQDAYQAYVDAQ